MRDNMVIGLITSIIEGVTENDSLAVGEAMRRLRSEDIQSDDLKKLLNAVLELTQKQNEASEFILNLSRGELDSDPPRHNQFISPFKELHSNLRHLVWQVGQFAAGDYNRKVEFSGAFTESFQQLSHSLNEKEGIQKALRERETLYRVTLNASPDGIILTDLEGNVTMASPSAIKILACTEGECIGNKKIYSFVVPDDWDRLKLNTDKLIHGGKPQINEYSGMRADGSFFDIEITGDLIKDENGNPSGVVYDMRDITDRNRTEIKLQESEQRYRLLVENANEGILVAQGEKLKFVNPMMLQISGYTMDEILSSPFIEFVHKDDHHKVVGNYIKRLNSEYVDARYQFRVLTKNQGIKWVEVSGASIDWDGKPATFNFMTDITERKIAEQEIAYKNEELINLNAEKDKLFSIIAHDLRSPFSSFMSYTEMMVEHLYNMSIQEIQEMAVEMKKSAFNLYNLLENLLEWSRMQSGLTSFVHSPFLLKPKISESMALLLQAASKKGIEISNHIPENLIVNADANMLNSIVRNLASNAIKFSNKGGTINLNARPLNSDYVEISIRDTGIGMNNGLIEKLFKLTKETGRIGTEGEPSTGLGLLLCKGFIEKHGGQIWAESEEGKGTIFYFTLPSGQLSE